MTSLSIGGGGGSLGPAGFGLRRNQVRSLPDLLRAYRVHHLPLAASSTHHSPLSTHNSARTTHCSSPRATECGERAGLSRLECLGGGLANQAQAGRGLSRVPAHAHRYRRLGGGEGQRGSQRASRRDLAQAVLPTPSTLPHLQHTCNTPATHPPLRISAHLPRRCRLADETRNEARDAHILTPKKARSIVEPDPV